MKLRYLLLAGGLAFVIALLVQTPAALVFAWTFASRPDAPVRLYGVDGSLFNGRALQASRGSQTLLRQLQWSARPAELMLGRAAYRVRADAPPASLEGTVAMGLGGTRISDFQTSGDLRALAAMLGQAFVPMNGQVGVQLDQLQLSDDWPVKAEGEVRLIGLAWALGREPVTLGDYQAQVATDGDDIVATIDTLAGTVDISGDARLKPDRSYVLDLRLRPQPDAPPMVTDLLRQLGPTDAQGNYRLRRVGAGTVNAGEAADAMPPPRAAPGQNQPTSELPAAVPAAPESSPRPLPSPDDESGLTFGP